MSPSPTVTAWTSAPLRNRIRVALDAPVGDVWALLGDLPRFPEYSAGLERVDAIAGPDGGCAAYVCHFKPTAPGEPGIVERNTMRWFEPGRGYASSGPRDSAFGLRNDVNLMILDPCPEGTLLTWDEYFDAQDVEAMRASFDEALADAAERLIARFGGRLLERYAGDTSEAASPGPVDAVAGLVRAVNRGDLDSAVALYEPDAVLLARPGEPARGREHIAAALQRFIALRPTLSSAASRVFESGEVALYLGRWSLTGVGPDGAPVTMGGESTDVLRRQADGRWLIALDNPWGAAVLT